MAFVCRNLYAQYQRHSFHYLYLPFICNDVSECHEKTTGFRLSHWSDFTSHTVKVMGHKYEVFVLKRLNYSPKQLGPVAHGQHDSSRSKLCIC